MDEKRTFAVVLEPEQEGGFTVRVPAIPEIVTYGKDEREALGDGRGCHWRRLPTARRVADPYPAASPGASSMISSLPDLIRQSMLPFGLHAFR